MLKKQRKLKSNRSNEIVSIRMRIGIKKELDDICNELKMTRNNFIINCILRGLNDKKKLPEINSINFFFSNSL